MTRHKDREYSQALYESVKHIAAVSIPPANQPAAHLLESFPQHERELRKMKKFRFQLLHRWLVAHFEPCRVADIGGGKGLLAHLLQQSGWQATVIDPIPETLPDKYKDITANTRVRIDSKARVPHISAPFSEHMAAHFDLLIGMHAHGSNALIIDAASEYGCGFILFPCCVIDEPFFPLPGMAWIESVAGYAVQQGHLVYTFRLNFKGQNIGLCSPGRCQLRDGDHAR